MQGLDFEAGLDPADVRRGHVEEVDGVRAQRDWRGAELDQVSEALVEIRAREDPAAARDPLLYADLEAPGVLRIELAVSLHESSREVLEEGRLLEPRADRGPNPRSGRHSVGGAEPVGGEGAEGVVVLEAGPRDETEAFPEVREPLGVEGPVPALDLERPAGRAELALRLAETPLVLLLDLDARRDHCAAAQGHVRPGVRGEPSDVVQALKGEESQRVRGVVGPVVEPPTHVVGTQQEAPLHARAEEAGDVEPQGPRVAELEGVPVYQVPAAICGDVQLVVRIAQGEAGLRASVGPHGDEPAQYGVPVFVVEGECAVAGEAVEREGVRGPLSAPS